MKNLLLLLAMLISTSTVFSQLYVKPNASSSTDSYIYVKDEVLFVEQDINLVLNTHDATTKASIYLREGAQLIQGTTSSANLGTGRLSVYQNAPDSDQWTYNYWCSPVGNEAIAGTGNKNFGVYRLYDVLGLTESDQTLTTTGYNGTSSPDLEISTRWMYTHPRGTETEGSYVRMYAGDNAATGAGFIMKGVDTTPVGGTGGVGFEYDFRGRANNGDISISVYDAELTLSGNPYPSALDLNRVFWDAANSEIDYFAYWDEAKDKDSHYYSVNAGGYGTFAPGSTDPNGVNGSGGFVPGVYVAPTFSIWDAAGNSTGDEGTGLDYERRFAPIGQGFMIVPDASGDGIVTIKNSHRRYIEEGAGNNSEFRNPGDGDTDPDPDPPNNYSLPLLRINTSFGTSHIRQMALVFSEECSDAYDRGFDARHPMDAVGADVYFPITRDNVEDEYVIQGVDFSIYKKVPVNFTLANYYKITVEVIEEVNFYEEAYLLDRQERTYSQITDGHKAEFDLEAGDYNRRFAIVFRDHRQVLEDSEGTIAEEEVIANVDFFQNNPYKRMEVFNPEGYYIESAAIYDMTGKLVATRTNVGTVSTFTISTSNVSDGVYLVKLITSEKIEIDYKAIIQNK